MIIISHRLTTTSLWASSVEDLFTTLKTCVNSTTLPARAVIISSRTVIISSRMMGYELRALQYPCGQPAQHLPLEGLFQGILVRGGGESRRRGGARSFELAERTEIRATTET